MASRPATERFYRLLRACNVYSEELREFFEGELECDETTFGGAGRGSRGRCAAGKGVIVLRIVRRVGEVSPLSVTAHSRETVIERIRVDAPRRFAVLYG